MRQRKLRNLDQKYEAFKDLIIETPADMRGNWAKLAAERTGRGGGTPPIYVEIGCGKGKFISELAEREPGNFFIAIEGNKSVMLRAMQKIRAGEIGNVIFVPEHAGDLTEWFAAGEVAGIYLNFSDPLPKNYYYKRRLTYRDRLKSYFEVMGEDGRVVFKTDNTDLFNWSVLETVAADLKIEEITRDLHADPDLSKDNIETEYEAKYSSLGQTIKRMTIKRRAL